MDDGRLLHRAQGHGAVVCRGSDKNRPVTWRRLLVPVALVVAGACGGATQEGPTVTGRVTTSSDSEVCVSRDPRLAVSDCVDVADLADARDQGAIDVGACASITIDESSTGGEASVQAVDEAACAAGDLGDGDD